MVVLQSWFNGGPKHLMATDVVLLIIFVLVALVFSFICSIAEAVLLSITPSHIENLRGTQPERAAMLKKLRQDNVDRSLAAILTVNTISHTVGAILAGAQATVVFGNAWIGLFSGAMTLAILFLSEIIPKTIGAVYWPSLVGVTAVFIRGSITVLYPLIWVSEKLTQFISRGKAVHVFSRDELVAMTNIGERSGLIEEHESRIIRNLMRFNSFRAADIMTPRTVITALDADSTVAQTMAVALDATFSRLPIYNGSLDDITGFVLKDDILAQDAQENSDIPLSDLRRDIPRVPESTSLPDLLEQFLDSRQHIAVVVDTYGGTAGLATLEDVIEALLGMEIVDEVDNVEDMQQLARKQWHSRAEKLGVDPDLAQAANDPTEKRE